MYHSNIVTFKAHTKETLRKILKIMNDYEVVQGVDFSFYKILSFQDILEWFQKSRKDQDTFHFALFDNKTDTYIGNGSLFNVDFRNRKGTIGVMIARNFWKKGFGPWYVIKI